MKRGLILVITILLILITIRGALAKEVKVSDLNYDIISQEKFYCQPIYKADGSCLINAYVDIVAKKNIIKQSLKVEYKDNKDFSKTVKNTVFKNTKSVDKSSGEKDFVKDTKTRIYFDFWTKESGKFDFVMGSLVLDPYYNVSINSSSPSYYLVNGTSVNIGDNEFIQKIQISNGLYDNSDVSSYELRYTLFNNQTKTNNTALYHFSEGSGIVSIDSSGYNHNGLNIRTRYSSAKGGNGTGTYALYFNNTARVNVSSNKQNSFSYPKSFSVGCWFNASKIPVSNHRGIIFKGQYNAGAQTEWGIHLDSVSNKTVFNIGNGTVISAYQGMASNSVILGKWTHVAVVVSPTNVTQYINGIMKIVTLIGSVKMKNNSRPLLIGQERGDGATPFNGKIDECFIYNTSLNSVQVKSIYDNGVVTNGAISQYGKSIKPYFNYALNYSNKHFLDIRKVTAGLQTFKVYPYINSTHINNTLFIIDILQQGWDIIEVTNILKSSKPMAFRIVSNNTGYANISEIRLIEERFDGTIPTITNCQMNNTNISCGETVLFTCNVTDNVELSDVFFGVQLQNYNYSMVDRITPNSSTFFEKITFPITTSNYNYSFVLVNATDFIGNYNIQLQNLTGQFSCCDNNWIQNDTFLDCSISDTGTWQILYYDNDNCGTSDGLPINNGTYYNTSCNYCDETIVQYQTECVDDNYKIYYEDFSFNSCCNTTNLPSDCHILNGSYYNVTIPCDSDIRCFTNENPFLKTGLPFSNRDKIDFYCEVNLTNYSCISEVISDGNILQTNPDYSTIDMFGAYNAFEGKTMVARGYYKKGTLLPDNVFSVKIKCSDGSQLKVYEWEINPKYKSLGFEVEKGIWVKRNWGYIFALAFVIIIIILLIYMVKR